MIATVNSQAIREQFPRWDDARAIAVRELMRLKAAGVDNGVLASEIEVAREAMREAVGLPPPRSQR